VTASTLALARARRWLFDYWRKWVAVTVSIILPAYNRADRLPEAINSILVQSFCDFELIVVDDASSEDIESVVRSIGDPRIRYIRHTVNGGASAARNTGLAEARGEFIAFHDSDDLWLPGKLKRQLEQLQKLPPEVGVVCGGVIIYGRDLGGKFGPGLVSFEPPVHEGQLSINEDQQARILQRNRVHLATSVFRRNCYPNLEWFDVRLRANVDWDFSVRLAAHTKIYEDLHPYLLGNKTIGDHISRNERQKILSLARIMKKNREVFSRYPKAHGFQLYRLGVGLNRLGKRRMGRRFVLAGIFRNPARLWGTVRRRLLGTEV
jgi:glycosyltransferase involved in cell wall biosynthesis